MDDSMRKLINLSQSDKRNLRNMVFDFNTGEHFTASIIFQLFCGLRYLHQDSLRFIHRDIKPDNILMKELSGGNWVLKIADLGLARHLQENESDVSAYVVTWPYRAPEVMIDDSYTFAIDIWSVGCIFSEMITGNQLFNRENQLSHFLRILFLVGFPEGTVLIDYIQKQMNEVPGMYGPNRICETYTDNILPTWNNQRITKQYIRDLLKRLLEYDPNKRLTAEEGVHLSMFNVLKSRSGKNDIAVEPYIPDVHCPTTEAGWKQLINRKLEAYDTERLNSLTSLWI